MAPTNNDNNIKSTNGKWTINMNKWVEERQMGNKHAKIFDLGNNGKYEKNKNKKKPHLYNYSLCLTNEPISNKQTLWYQTVISNWGNNRESSCYILAKIPTLVPGMHAIIMPREKKDRHHNRTNFTSYINFTKPRSMPT